MELTFLGTSSGAPTRHRNVSGLALRLDGTWDLFDCGEATQHQLLHTSLSLSKLRRVFISHLHGDHCFGLFGLLGSRSMDAASSPLSIYGPPGLRSMVETVLHLSSTHLTFPLDIHELDPAGGRVIELRDLTVDALPLTHRVESFAWSIREADRSGRFDFDAARAAGVPDGPLFARLQRGETIELDDGARVRPGDVCGPARPGRRVVIAGDNSDPASLFERVGDVDLAVHEATYTESVLARTGDDHGHSTAARVATAAERYGVKSLVLTHFSARYRDHGTGATIDDVRQEARQHFAGTLFLANDFDRFDIAHGGTTTSTGAADST